MMRDLIKKIKKLYYNEMAENVFWSFMSKGIAMVFFLLTDIALARLLKVNLYGEWAFFYSITTMIFYFVWFGVNISTKVFVSKCSNHEEEECVIRSGLLLRLAISTIFFFLFLILSQKIAYACGYPNKYSNLNVLMCFAGGLAFFNSFAEFYKEVNMGLQNYKNMFYTTAIEFGGNFVFVILCFFVMESIIGVAIGYSISGMVTLITGLCLLKKSNYKYKGQINNNITKKIIEYSIPLIIIGCGNIVLLEMDTVMIGIFSSTEQVALYSIGKKLVNKLTHINYALCIGTMSSFSILTSKNMTHKIKQFKAICKLNLAITLVIILFLLCFGSIIISTVYGESYKSAGKILVFLLPYYFMYSVSNLFSVFLDFQKKAGYRSMCYILIIIVNFILNYLLIPIYGGYGAAIATSVSMIPYTILITAGTYRVFKINIKGIEK